MNTIYKYFIIAGIMAFIFASCKDEFGPRKESTPVIGSASVSPQSFSFGDSIQLSATITDPATMLTTLFYEVESEGKVLSSGEIPLAGNEYEVDQSIFVPLVSNQDDNVEVKVNLVARNILKGSVEHEITGLTGRRPAFSQLYLVTEDGTVATLQLQAGSQNLFKGQDLTLETSFNYKIAEKLHPDNTIDYSGSVFGNNNGKMSLVDEAGESAFVFSPSSDYTKEFIFDSYTFNVSTTGSMLGPDDIALSAFGNADIYGETFRTLKRTLEKDKIYPVFGKLAESQNVYNPDFFERVAPNQIKFLGETGEYTLYYNPVRKNIFPGVDNPSYPNYLLACGWGLGYPTNVTSSEIAAVYPGHQRTHTNWGFGHVMDYVLLRKTSEGVYQGTFFTPGENDHYAGFKPFENTGWANEKKAGEFTFTGEQIIKGNNDWTIPNGENDPVIEPAHYRFTVNLTDKTVHIEKVTL